MSDDKGVNYASSGVDISRQDEALRRIKPIVKTTKTPNVRSDLGLFGGLFAAQFSETKPILVSSMDGVGTKMKVARLAHRWDTVGQDLVNHCINDILVQGARPLFFLDYIASDRLEPEIIESIVSGMAVACRASNCSLIGGELAEMPGVYASREIDVAGTIVGVVDEPLLLPLPEAMKEGDYLIALPSSGLHTNGYSLARKIIFELKQFRVDEVLPGTNELIGDLLLAVHRSYLTPLMTLIEEQKIKGMAHITGGGLTDNIPRVLPSHLDAEVQRSSWEIPPLFRFLIEEGRLSMEEASQAFNLGVGMVVIVDKDQSNPVLDHLQSQQSGAWVLGRLKAGTGLVKFQS
ncbi:MAG: phosphoribosylformylglycinamidine cyclo-ligase [Holophagaceae bacterium]|jgi:phosphoribosylformylglycinamidine cyclo-ligase